MSMIEYGDYILGKKFVEGQINPPFRMKEADMVELSKLLASYPYAKDNLNVSNTASEFYKLEPDMSNRIPASKREEYFYTAKVGSACAICSAKVVYFIKQAIEKYGSPNYFLYLLSERDLRAVFSAGYVTNGYTLRDVICSVSGLEDYMPLTEASPKVKIGEHFDVYIKDTDAIAMLPASIANLLSPSDIDGIKREKDALVLSNGKLLKTLADHVGVVNSVYDLREVI